MEQSVVLKRASLKDTRKFFFWFNNSTSIKNKIKTKKKNSIFKSPKMV